jgi:hypothetical protein
VIALRPLGVGDFFDGAFKTIRRNPKAMVGLAALVTATFLVLPALLTLGLAAAGDLGAFDEATDPFGTGSTGSTGGAAAMTYLGAFFGMFASVVLNGILVHVVAEAVLGRRTTIGAAWSRTRGRMWRLVALMLLDLVVILLLVGAPVAAGVLTGIAVGVAEGFLVGVPLLGLAMALLAFLQVRFFLLAPAALVLEGTGVVASLRRAGALSHRQFWRLFGIWLLTALVVGVAGQVLALPLGFVGTIGGALVPGTAGTLVFVFSGYLSQIVVGAVTTPFTSAVTALQYVDQRIRKEGLDVQLIAASQRGPAGPR